MVLFPTLFLYDKTEYFFKSFSFVLKEWQKKTIKKIFCCLVKAEIPVLSFDSVNRTHHLKMGKNVEFVDWQKRTFSI